MSVCNGKFIYIFIINSNRGLFVSLDRTGVGTGRFAAASQARLAFGRWPGSEGEQEAAAAAASSSTLISSALNPPQAPHTSMIYK